MRYYNENPQVTFWREKYEELKAENEALKDDIAYLTLEANSLNNQLENNQKKQEEEDQQVRLRAERFVDSFNSLPWYKKMFYKFNIKS